MDGITLELKSNRLIGECLEAIVIQSVNFLIRQAIGFLDCMPVLLLHPVVGFKDFWIVDSVVFGLGNEGAAIVAEFIIDVTIVVAVDGHLNGSAR